MEKFREIVSRVGFRVGDRSRGRYATIPLCTMAPRAGGYACDVGVRNLSVMFKGHFLSRRGQT
jgi:hypothetical protein